MNRFLLFGTWNGIRVRWDDSFNDLDADQQAFAKRVASVLKDSHEVMKAPKGSLAHCMYNNDNDFIGAVHQLKDGVTREEVEQQMTDLFDAGEGDAPSTAFAVGDEYTIDELCEFTTEDFAPTMRSMLDMLDDGGIFPWVNGGVVFERRGDKFVVTRKL